MEEGKIEKVVFGGEGLLKEASGRVVWIPLTIDGETIEYEIQEEKSSYARGKLLNILTASDQRVEPKCPHYGICEGCQLQHVHYSHQLNLKTAWLKELLRRIAGLDVDVPPMLEQSHWEYRRSVEWVWKQGQLGYSGAHGSFIPIQVCFLLKNSEQALAQVKNILEKLHQHQARVRWLQTKDDKPILSIDTPEKPPSGLIHALWKELQAHFKGWIFHQKRKPFLLLGQPFTEEEVLGLKIRWHGLSFIQNHAEGSLAFYRWIEKRLESILETSSHSLDKSPSLIDLYCGSGITSLIAARLGFEVEGFEISSHALTGAKENAKVNELKVHFHRVDLQVAELSHPLLVGERNIPYWIANPARSGLSDSLCQVMGKKADHLIYLSCDPATLARDIKKLTHLGLTISAIQGFDCFAQTTHFEVAVHLKRKS